MYDDNELWQSLFQCSHYRILNKYLWYQIFCAIWYIVGNRKFNSINISLILVTKWWKPMRLLLSQYTMTFKTWNEKMRVWYFDTPIPHQSYIIALLLLCSLCLTITSIPRRIIILCQNFKNMTFLALGKISLLSFPNLRRHRLNRNH